MSSPRAYATTSCWATPRTSSPRPPGSRTQPEPREDPWQSAKPACSCHWTRATAGHLPADKSLSSDSRVAQGSRESGEAIALSMKKFRKDSELRTNPSRHSWCCAVGGHLARAAREPLGQRLSGMLSQRG